MPLPMLLPANSWNDKDNPKVPKFN